MHLVQHVSILLLFLLKTCFSTKIKYSPTKLIFLLLPFKHFYFNKFNLFINKVLNNCIILFFLLNTNS